MNGTLPDSFIEQVRDQTDILEVIGQYVGLKKRGRNWFGLCPFHSERTPSFSVYPEKGIFKCFGCGKSGDVFKFLMEQQALTFGQAVESLAQRLGISPPRSSHDDKEDEARKRLIYAHQFARDFYHRLLLSAPEGLRALEYLKKRGLDDQTIESFELGWAPDSWESFKLAALEHGIEEQVLIEAGLLSRSEDSGKTFDRFRARVIFPIRDTKGRTIAFGGRVLGDGEPKYLNSPETPLFRKGEVLFGLDKARGLIRQYGRAIVVEGYMDLISLHRHGIGGVVAPLGTALTPDQARLLSRYTREVILLYDADSPGLKASFRGGAELLKAALAVRVVTLPDGLDPDDFVRTKGPDSFNKLVASAKDLLERKMEILAERFDLDDPAAREKAADKLLETVTQCRDKLMRSLYLQKVAGFIGVPENVLTERLQLVQRSLREGLAGSGSGKQPKKHSEVSSAERYLLALCLKNPEYIHRTLEILGREPFSHPGYAQVFETLARALAQNEEVLAENLYQELPQSLHAVVDEIQLENRLLEPPEEVFGICWPLVKIECVNKQIDLITRESKTRDDNKLLQELINLKKQKNELQALLKHSRPGAVWLPKSTKKLMFG